MRLLSIMAICVVASPVFAQDRDRPDHAISDGGSVSLTFENDIVGGTDEAYTNGIRLTFVTPRNDLPWIGRFARRHLNWLTDAEDWYGTFALGQNIYTPVEIIINPPDPDDRPYAGFSYVSVGISADRGDRLDTLALDVGVVGELAQADDIQRLVHDLGGFDDPAGWDSQLKNEPGVRLLYERKYRFGFESDLPFFNLEMDVLPSYSFALGNVDTSASAGLTLRIGDQLGDNYGPPRVLPALASPGFFEEIDGIGWYLYAGVDGRFVGRNIFLEGNTFRNSPSVEPHRFVADFQAGFALQFQDVELAYTHVFRSPEFQGQKGFAQFGSLTLSYKF